MDRSNIIHLFSNPADIFQIVSLSLSLSPSLPLYFFLTFNSFLDIITLPIILAGTALGTLTPEGWSNIVAKFKDTVCCRPVPLWQ